MSQQWYYQVMGAEVGPISAADLKQRVRKNQIQPDTLVRLGPNGRWQTADRVKGLLDAPPPTVAKPQASRPADPEPAPPSKGPAPPKKPPSSAEVALYHIAGEGNGPDDPTPVDGEPQEYDFFRFVGFEQAIGPALHEVLVKHCSRHQLSMTQATRMALAEFLGRKDLLQPQAATGNTAAAPTESAVPE